jgi:putative IMPACT (imprinted ancient) family translation regulator
LESIALIRAPSITERKSVFLGQCAHLTDVSQVALVLSEVLSDRKISRATHPAIYAWVCKDNKTGVVHRDCDDDGETAAGGRLAHLLDLLHMDNVIVIVTRWYGGVQLGPDRFKLINRAARDALEVAQLVTGPLNPRTSEVAKANR